MTLYEVWILALYIAAMLCFAAAALGIWGRGVPVGLLLCATVGFSVTVNSLTT